MSEEKQKTKHAVDTEALQSVLTYLENSTGVYKEVYSLITNLTRDAVQVTLTAPAPPTATATEPEPAPSADQAVS